MKTISHEELLSLSYETKYADVAVPLVSESNSLIKDLIDTGRGPFNTNLQDFSGALKQVMEVRFVPLLKLSEQTPRRLFQKYMSYMFDGGSSIERQVTSFVTAFSCIHTSLGEYVPYIADAINMLTNGREYGRAALVINEEGVLGISVEFRDEKSGYIIPINELFNMYNYVMISDNSFGIPSKVVHGAHYHGKVAVKIRVTNQYEVNEILFRLNLVNYQLGSNPTSLSLTDETIAKMSEDFFNKGESYVYIEYGENSIKVSRHSYKDCVASYMSILDFLLDTPNSFNRYGSYNGDIESEKVSSLSVTSLRSGELYEVQYDGEKFLLKYWKRRDAIVARSEAGGNILTNGGYLTYSSLPIKYVFMFNSVHFTIKRANSAQRAQYARAERYIYDYRRSLIETNWRSRIQFRTQVLNKKHRNNPDLETKLFSDSLFNALSKFVKDNTVAKTLVKLSSLGYYKDSTRNITIKSDLSMTYTPSGKDTEITENHTWSSKGRQVSKYGKLFRKILKEQVPRKKFCDHDIERLVNSIKAEYDVGKISIVRGEDIRYWYNEDNHYDGNTGTLSSSCMRHSHCSPWFDIYTENPDQVQLVILTKDNALRGRALLWDNKWLDRIYGTDVTISMFKKYAKENGYWHKESQDSSTGNFVSPNGDTESAEDISIMLDNSYDIDCSFPYLDTFYCLDTETGELSGYLSGTYVTELRSTDGEHSLNEEDRVWDDWDDQYIHEEDACYLEGRGIYTHVDNCTMCEITDEWILTDDAICTLDGITTDENHARYLDYHNDYVSDEVYVVECEFSGEEFAPEYAEYTLVKEDDVYVLNEFLEEYYEEQGETTED